VNIFDWQDETLSGLDHYKIEMKKNNNQNQARFTKI
jgi:hypothetical protein